MFKNNKSCILVAILILCFIILVLVLNFLKPKNPYGFENFSITEKKKNSVSIEKWETTMKKIKKTMQLENMEDIVVSIGDRKITRKEYEGVRIRQADIFSYTVKETVYSIVKDCVIIQEAERLKLVPDQKKIDYYMNGIYDALKIENEPGFEFETSRIKILEMTNEEYIDEQKRVAYEMFQKDALYEYLKKDEKKFEDYIKKLLRSANIKIYDTNIKRECLE